MVDEERAAASKGRVAGLSAARDAFYRGDIARAIVAYHEENNGLLTMQDLQDFRVGVEPSVSIKALGGSVHACGPWCQGPVLLQMLKLLEGLDVGDLGHNTLAYSHTLVEAMKLAFADREAHYADPRFSPVPMETLLSDDYNQARQALIRPDRALIDVAAGNLHDAPALDRAARASMDTSYVCAIDQQGNAFSATPSDVANDTPIIPGTGIAPSSPGFAILGQARSSPRGGTRDAAALDPQSSDID